MLFCKEYTIVTSEFRVLDISSLKESICTLSKWLLCMNYDNIESCFPHVHLLYFISWWSLVVSITWERQKCIEYVLLLAPGFFLGCFFFKLNNPPLCYYIYLAHFSLLKQKDNDGIYLCKSNINSLEMWWGIWLACVRPEFNPQHWRRKSQENNV